MTNRHTVVIVDDEPLAREGLRDAVARVAGDSVVVTALCENGIAALAHIRDARPDVLLLDVAMPVLDGFATLERLEPDGTPPAVIFVTAFDEHAVRAFEAEAVDFLVKPVSDDRLRSALDRAVRRIAESTALRDAAGRVDGVDRGTTYLQQIVISERERRLIVPVREIDWIEGDTYYVRIHAAGRVRLLRDRLSRLEAALDPAQFHRTHRSSLVRLELVREIHAHSPYSYSATLSTGQRVPVSRERLKGLEAALAAVRRG